MPITVEFHPTKEEIFKKIDKECKDLAEKLRETGDVYIDPDFPPNITSLGASDTRDKPLQKSENPWFQPKEFIKPHSSREGCVDEWKVWDDPHPFHVQQGALGNCWLKAALKNKKKPIVIQLANLLKRHEIEKG